MSQVIKIYMGMFFVLLLLLTGVELLQLQSQVIAANDFKLIVVEEIRDSNFSKQVIAAKQDEARQKGYELIVGEVMQEADSFCYAKAVLKYPLELRRLGIVTMRQIEFLAR